MGYGMRPLLISASMDTTIRLWDVASQKQLEVLQYKESQVNDMCITPDGAQFLIGAWQNLRIYDLNCLTATGLHNSTVHEKNVTTVGFQGDGVWMYTGGEDCMAKIWDLRINQLNCQRIFQVNTPVHSIALHPNQVELLIADSTGAIYLWDLRSDRDDSLVTEVDLSEYIVHIDVDRLGKQCAAVTNRGHLFFWDIAHRGGIIAYNSAEPLQKQNNIQPRVLLGPHLQTTDDFYTAVSDTGLPPIAPPPPPEMSSTQMALSNLQTFPTNLPDKSEDSEQQIKRAEEQQHFVQTAKPSTSQQSIRSIKKHVAKLRAHRTFALKCRYQPDGLAVATTSADQTTKLWSVADHSLLNTYAVPGNKWVWDCAFTADSAFMINASSDGILRMWDLATSNVIRMYQGHSMGITCMAFKDFT